MTSAARETIAVLKANGITRMVGNPGTTELALLDATVSQGMDFHLCLHEGAAVAMADGFGRATGTTGVVMVHTSVGTANTLTNLINVRSDAQPLLVIAGDKDDRLGGRGCFCEVPDLPGLVRQVTKEAWRVTLPEKLPELTLRALKVARAPTPGPVFISAPENHMSAELPADAVGQHAHRATAVDLRAHPDHLRAILAALASTRDFALAWEALTLRGVDGAPQKAKQYLEKALKERPEDPVVLAAWGFEEQKKGHDQEAREFYERALKIDPLLNDAATNLGILEGKAGNLRSAVELWQGAFARLPERSAVGVYLGMAFCVAGQKEEARKYVERVLEFNPDYLKAKSLLVHLGEDPVECKP